MGPLRCNPQSTQGSADVFHQQHQVELVGRRRFELWDEVPVEVPRLGGLGVDEQGTTADLLPERVGPRDHVAEQPGSEPVTLVVGVYTEAGEQRDRLRERPAPFRARAETSADATLAMHHA